MKITSYSGRATNVNIYNRKSTDSLIDISFVNDSGIVQEIKNLVIPNELVASLTTKEDMVLTVGTISSFFYTKKVPVVFAVQTKSGKVDTSTYISSFIIKLTIMNFLAMIFSVFFALLGISPLALFSFYFLFRTIYLPFSAMSIKSKIKAIKKQE